MLFEERFYDFYDDSDQYFNTIDMYEFQIMGKRMDRGKQDRILRKLHEWSETYERKAGYYGTEESNAN
jgi:hypothetical protein